MSKELKQIGDDILASLKHLGPQKIDISLGTNTWLNTVPILDNVVASDYFFHLSENILGNPSLLLGKSEFIAPYSNEATNLAKESQEQLQETKEAKFKGIKTNRIGSFGELAQRLLIDKKDHPKENGFLDAGNGFNNIPLEEQILNHSNESEERYKDQPITLDHKKEIFTENNPAENKRKLIESNIETDLVPSTNNVVEINRFPKENGIDNNGELADLFKSKNDSSKPARIGSFAELASSLLKNEKEAKVSGANTKEIEQKDVGKKSEDNFEFAEQKRREANQQITKQQEPIIDGDLDERPKESNLKDPFVADLNTSAIKNLVTILKDVANKPESVASLELVKVITQLLNTTVKSSDQLYGEVGAISQNEKPALGEKELFGNKEANPIIPFLKSSKITAQIDNSGFEKSKELRLSYRRFYGE